MADRVLTLAFAGEGASTYQNTSSLLNDFLGVEDDSLPEGLDLRLIFPATKAHLTKTLEGVLKWTEAIDVGYDVVVNDEGKSRAVSDVLEYANETIEAIDVSARLVQELASDKEEGEVYLVLSWGEDGDDISEELLEAAKDAGIPALDLSAGLDDLDFGEVDEGGMAHTEPEPAPPRSRRRRREPESGHDADPDDRHEQSTTAAQHPDEVDPAPRRRRGRPRSLETEEKPLEDEKADEPTPQRKARRSRAQEPADEAQATGEVNEAADKAQASAGSLERKFNFHRANEVTVPKHERLRDETLALARIYEEIIPSEAAHEKHLAITQLEAAMMWAHAGVARYEGGENPDTTQVVGDEKPAEQPSTGRRSPGKPRADGSPAQARTPADRAVMEVQDEVGNWAKKGRGRLPKGAIWRKVDPKTGDVLEEGGPDE